jgi:hypothetical protein
LKPSRESIRIKNHIDAINEEANGPLVISTGQSSCLKKEVERVLEENEEREMGNTRDTVSTTTLSALVKPVHLNSVINIESKEPREESQEIVFAELELSTEQANSSDGDIIAPTRFFFR